MKETLNFCQISALPNNKKLKKSPQKSYKGTMADSELGNLVKSRIIQSGGICAD